MSGAKNTERLTVPRSGAFAAGAPEAGSVLAEVMDDAVREADQPAAAPSDETREQEQEAPGVVPQAPRQRARRAAVAPRKRAGAARPPMPARIAESDSGVPLQVKLPKSMHWDLKVATTLQGSDMTRVMRALATVYLQDPELVEVLIDKASRADQPLGELVHDALTDVAADQ